MTGLPLKDLHEDGASHLTLNPWDVFIVVKY